MARIHPPASLNERQIEALKGKIAEVTSNRVQGSTGDTRLPLPHGRHPHPTVVVHHQALGVRVSRTDHDGIIASKTDRHSLQVVPDVGPPAEVPLQELPALADLMTPRRVAGPELQGFPWRAASHRTAGWDIDRLDIPIFPFI